MPEGADDTGGDRLRQVRLDKAQRLRASGVEPYPYSFDPNDTTDAIRARHIGLDPETDTGEVVTVAGRIVGWRDIGKLVFGVLQDHTGRIQLFCDQGVLGEDWALLADLDIGDWVGATGEVITTRRGELSIRPTSITLLAKSLRPLPEKWHGLKDIETRYRQRYVDLIVNDEAREALVIRARLVDSLRRSFIERGFMEVETPMLQVSPGGALARPFVTHHNALDIDMYLRIAPELYLKRLIVGGFSRVFELSRVFRNEGLEPTRNPEFTMLESYMAYADYHEVMTLVEDVIAEAAEAVLGSTSFTYGGRTIDLAGPWPRLKVVDSVVEATGVEFDMAMGKSDAIARAEGLDIEVDAAWGVGKIITEVFEETVEKDLWDPTFVIDYPQEVSPLAKDHRDGGGVTERFEFFIGGRELGNAYSELNDPVEQRKRFEQQAAARAEGDDEAHPIDEDYIRALEFGMPPTGGLGIGVDRLAMLFADVTSIRDVILFPHMRPE
ncbi:MAG: lysine--tRNA ligase [Acidimicrobiia bacterium]|nr:lysine--tRNA ligase [Acidimicrobiia bacterium]